VIKLPAKFIRCVKKVKKKQHGRDYPYNPYAVCRVSTGYYGTSHNIGLIHKIKKDKISQKDYEWYDKERVKKEYEYNKLIKKLSETKSEKKKDEMLKRFIKKYHHKEGE
jgi:cupin superfamily acireductone dioxygenase involved in methionine salvage